MTFNWRRAVMRGTLAVAAALLLASLVGSFQGASAQGPPARLYGSATVDGVAASAGTNITATIAGVDCGQTTVEADGTYVLNVVASGPAEFEPSARPGCGTEAATVDLTVDGCGAGTATWSGGAFIAQDLAAVCVEEVPTVAPETPTLAPPIIGSGGDLGGGSGTAWWALAAGASVLALAGSAGWMAYRRTVR
jgi:hypothetical protein